MTAVNLFFHQRGIKEVFFILALNVSIERPSSSAGPREARALAHTHETGQEHTKRAMFALVATLMNWWDSTSENETQKTAAAAHTTDERAGVRLLQHSNHDPVGRDSTTNHIRAGGGTTTTDVRHYRRQPHDTVVSPSSLSLSLSLSDKRRNW